MPAWKMIVRRPPPRKAHPKRMAKPAPDDLAAPPRALAAIRAEPALATDPPCCEDAGRLARCLAASKVRGVLLQLGSGSAALSAWLVDGMDITSRLIALHPGEARLDATRRVAGNDIRVAVHAQAAASFLEDMQRNRFDLVVVDRPDTPGALLVAAIALLAPGGMLCLMDGAGTGRPPGEDALSALAGNDDCRWTRLQAPVAGLLATRCPPESRPVRRGGRSARHAAGRVPVTTIY